jgi:hypothetical protein
LLLIFHFDIELKGFARGSGRAHGYEPTAFAKSWRREN